MLERHGDLLLLATVLATFARLRWAVASAEKSTAVSLGVVMVGSRDI